MSDQERRVQIKRDLLDKKWTQLAKRGLTRPENSVENRERAKKAHVK